MKAAMNDLSKIISKYKVLTRIKLGEKIPPNFFQVFICFLIVSATQPEAIVILEIRCAYQVSG